MDLRRVCRKSVTVSLLLPQRPPPATIAPGSLADHPPPGQGTCASFEARAGAVSGLHRCQYITPPAAASAPPQYHAPPDRHRSACTSIVARAGAIIRRRAASTPNNAATALARALRASHRCLRGRRLSPPPPLPHSKPAVAAPVGASTLAWAPFSATPPFRNQIQSPPLDARTAASSPNNAAMAGSLSERPPPNQGAFASFDARAGAVPFSATPPTPKNDGTARVQPPRAPSLASPLSGIPKRCHGACGSFDALVGVHLCHPGHPQPETAAVTPA
ncbi:hypothetical protein HYPSUDRAFT_209516 [Hypholoma sublateritium FD-334 SS-4]|uniref:Uncharacterized protein n=1 Tax=Hypholoma sublateritium (strain FD-334 SS-4) TaxID=945553 RepID=A0A0D2KG34_HYPSF|nr:hypothetical protein HYPSUDRAFT_209516 [Hypholoma sublateritium FD-334 SS-4]